jgi:ribonuclease kappa
MVLSVWGVVMLLLLGVFLKIYSPAFVEDLSIDENEWQEKGEDYIKEVYTQASLNCFIAAALYVGVFVFSLIQHRLNLRATYLTT